MTVDPRITNGASLVYLPSGKTAHLAQHAEEGDTYCQVIHRRSHAPDGSTPYLLGTGSQDEWEHARSLPLCTECFPHGPRRPQWRTDDH